MSAPWERLLFLLISGVLTVGQVFAASKYYGKLLGDFETKVHGVKGKVYATTRNTFFISGFEYDGQGPDAFFWGDTEVEPTTSGFIIPNEKGTYDVLKEYRKKDLILVLPPGKTINDIKSLSVWCRKFSVNFGSLKFINVDLPKELSLGPLPSFAHGVRANDVVIKDSKTLFISKLYYDGAGPDAFFLVGNGTKPHSKGIKVPDENQSLKKLKGYQGKDVTLQLPENLTVFDIGWFGLYCIAFEQNFGHVLIPAKPNIPASVEELKSAIASSNSRIYSSPSSKAKNGKYYGKLIGEIKGYDHGVKGTVFAASENTFFITNFSYDGKGPDAFFWAGTTEKPSPEGFIVPDEFGTQQVLKEYKDQDIAITLPDGKKITDVKWLSIWCRRFTANFGTVVIPIPFEVPHSTDLGPLSTLSHGVSAKHVIVKDAKTIAIVGLHYDGEAPDAFFFVGQGKSPSATGVKVPDETGSLNKLRKYQGQDVELRLPDGVDAYNIDWIAIYCLSFQANFGHVLFPENLNVPADIPVFKEAEMTFDNCEPLFPGILHVSWKVVGQDLFLQLSGIIGDQEYFAFGRSGHDDHAAMVGADVVLAFYDPEEQKAKVVDYYLSEKAQCSQGSGACPDVKLRGSENAELIGWNKIDHLFSVTYKRPLAAADGQDLSLPMSIPLSVVAAIGRLNSLKEAAFHSHYYTKDSKKIHFGRTPAQNRCDVLKPFMSEDLKPVQAWPALHIKGETTFRAQIGPTGGDKGYSAITGIQSWGYSWWINGLLIPEITVHRGVNYTFIVEGGNNPANPANFHPFYITNNPEGGGGQFLDQLGSENHVIYAGIISDGEKLIPAGIGRLCQWTPFTVDRSNESESFNDYKSTLHLKCEDGKPGTFYWVPDEDTPDLVYYQCFNHRNFGWKIHVIGDKHKGTSSVGHLSGMATGIVAHLSMTSLLLLLLPHIFITL